MSLLGNLFGGIAGNALSGMLGQSQGQGMLVNLLGGLIKQSGGISGLVQKFASAGLGDHASQWVAKGPNPPISGDQFTQVFGQQQVQQLAQQMGMQPHQAASGLAALLPGIVDQLTPDGHAVQGEHLDNGLAALAQKGLGGFGLGDIAKLFGH